MLTETRDQFIARYPNPNPDGKYGTMRRVLVRCECDWEACTGWAWGYDGDLSPWETSMTACESSAPTNKGEQE